MAQMLEHFSGLPLIHALRSPPPVIDFGGTDPPLIVRVVRTTIPTFTSPAQRKRRHIARVKVMRLFRWLLEMQRRARKKKALALDSKQQFPHTTRSSHSVSATMQGSFITGNIVQLRCDLDAMLDFNPEGCFPGGQPVTKFAFAL